MAWLGFPLVFLIGPEGNCLVLSEQQRNLLWRPVLNQFIPLFGEGLLFTDGDLHDRLRRLVLPAFQHGRMDDYLPLMEEYAARFLDRWQPGQVVRRPSAPSGSTRSTARPTRRSPTCRSVGGRGCASA